MTGLSEQLRNDINVKKVIKMFLISSFKQNSDKIFNSFLTDDLQIFENKLDIFYLFLNLNAFYRVKVTNERLKKFYLSS